MSAFADGDAKLLRLVENETDLSLAVIVPGEYLYGVRQSRHQARYEQWMGEVLPLLDLLAVEEETARHYAGIRHELKAAGLPIPSNDLWIAALARQHRLPVVSRDRHFEAVKGIRLLTW
ncbi:MAG: PIN domain-containing protein [Bryobacteraceae bacterium]